nr:hypothetical protein Itr_chr12CG20440 [Ipomoea trifida]
MASSKVGFLALLVLGIIVMGAMWNMQRPKSALNSARRI